jgi:hypothetical protein
MPSSSAIQPPGTNPSAPPDKGVEKSDNVGKKAFEEALKNAQTKGKMNPPTAADQPPTAADQKEIAPDKNPKTGGDKWLQEIQAVINEGA